jgi:RNA polymerase sigma-70 factor (ECF subfamily)
MHISDATLLERWTANRDAEAFHELVSRHAGMVFATSLRILGNREDANDTAQACFIKLADRVIPTRESLAGLLHTMAQRESYNLRKADTRRQVRERAYSDAHAEPDTITFDDISNHVDAAIGSLPEKERAIIVAHFLEGQTHGAIAEELGLERSTVSYRARKGVERIRTTLSKQGITASVAALTSTMATATADAAPPQLAASIGKLAGAGTAGTSVAASAGVFTLWKAAALATVFVAIGGGFFLIAQSANDLQGQTTSQPNAQSSTHTENVDEVLSRFAASLRTIPEEIVFQRTMITTLEGDWNRRVAPLRVVDTGREVRIDGHVDIASSRTETLGPEADFNPDSDRTTRHRFMSRNGDGATSYFYQAEANENTRDLYAYDPKSTDVEFLVEKAMLPHRGWSNIFYGYVPGNPIDSLLDDFLVKTGTAQLRDATESIDGHEVLVIEADTSHGKHTLWVDPNAGYHPRRIEIVRSGDDLLGDKAVSSPDQLVDDSVLPYLMEPNAIMIDEKITVDATRIEKVGDRYVLTGGRVTQHHRFESGESTTRTVEYRWEDYDLAPELAALNAFRLDVPVGTPVNFADDRDVGETVHVWQGTGIVPKMKTVEIKDLKTEMLGVSQSN